MVVFWKKGASNGIPSIHWFTISFRIQIAKLWRDTPMVKQAQIMDALVRPCWWLTPTIPILTPAWWSKYMPNPYSIAWVFRDIRTYERSHDISISEISQNMSRPFNAAIFFGWSLPPRTLDVIDPWKQSLRQMGRSGVRKMTYTSHKKNYVC